MASEVEADASDRRSSIQLEDIDSAVDNLVSFNLNFDNVSVVLQHVLRHIKREYNRMQHVEKAVMELQLHRREGIIAPANIDALELTQVNVMNQIKSSSVSNLQTTVNNSVQVTGDVATIQQQIQQQVQQQIRLMTPRLLKQLQQQLSQQKQPIQQPLHPVEQPQQPAQDNPVNSFSADAFDQEFDQLGQGLRANSEELDNFIEQHKKEREEIDKTFSTLEQRVDSLEARKKHDSAIAIHESRIEVLEKKLKLNTTGDNVVEEALQNMVVKQRKLEQQIADIQATVDGYKHRIAEAVLQASNAVQSASHCEEILALPDEVPDNQVVRPRLHTKMEELSGKVAAVETAVSSYDKAMVGLRSANSRMDLLEDDTAKATQEIGQELKVLQARLESWINTSGQRAVSRQSQSSYSDSGANSEDEGEEIPSNGPSLEPVAANKPEISEQKVPEEDVQEKNQEQENVAPHMLQGESEKQADPAEEEKKEVEVVVVQQPPNVVQQQVIDKLQANLDNKIAGLETKVTFLIEKGLGGGGSADLITSHLTQHWDERLTMELESLKRELNAKADQGSVSALMVHLDRLTAEHTKKLQNSKFLRLEKTAEPADQIFKQLEEKVDKKQLEALESWVRNLDKHSHAFSVKNRELIGKLSRGEELKFAHLRGENQSEAAKVQAKMEEMVKEIKGELQTIQAKNVELSAQLQDFEGQKTLTEALMEVFGAMPTSFASVDDLQGQENTSGLNKTLVECMKKIMLRLSDHEATWAAEYKRFTEVSLATGAHVKMVQDALEEEIKTHKREHEKRDFELSSIQRELERLQIEKIQRDLQGSIDTMQQQHDNHRSSIMEVNNLVAELSKRGVGEQATPTAVFSSAVSPESLVSNNAFIGLKNQIRELEEQLTNHKDWIKKNGTQVMLLREAAKVAELWRKKHLSDADSETGKAKALVGQVQESMHIIQQLAGSVHALDSQVDYLRERLVSLGKGQANDSRARQEISRLLAEANKASVLTTKKYMPDWKCMSCNQTMPHIHRSQAGRGLPRYDAFQTSVASIYPAGGGFGSGTRSDLRQALTSRPDYVSSKLGASQRLSGQETSMYTQQPVYPSHPKASTLPSQMNSNNNATDSYKGKSPRRTRQSQMRASFSGISEDEG